MTRSRTARELLRAGRDRLARSGVESSRLDAEVLLMHLLGVDRAGLYLALDEPADAASVADFTRLIERRAAGEPVAYITRRREFMGLDFYVDGRVLVPRPETEWLVEWALREIAARPGRPPRLADVGTGSGAIVVSIGHYLERPEDVVLVGSDLSRAALEVAAGNAARHAPGRVRLVCGDLLTWCRGPLDLVVANLPYLRDDQAHPGIAAEPAGALFAGPTGFSLYERLLPEAAARLAPGGALAAEIDPRQRDLARALARRIFPEAAVTIERDLVGQARYLVVARTGRDAG